MLDRLHCYTRYAIIYHNMVCIHWCPYTLLPGWHTALTMDQNVDAIVDYLMNWWWGEFGVQAACALAVRWATRYNSVNRGSLRAFRYLRNSFHFREGWRWVDAPQDFPLSHPDTWVSVYVWCTHAIYYISPAATEYSYAFVIIHAKTLTHTDE